MDSFFKFLAAIIIAGILSFPCKSPTIKADLILHNGVIYTVDNEFTVAEAMAVRNGKILSTGSSGYILKKYSADEVLDLEGGVVIPGIFDAHAHFMEYGKQMLEADLRQTESYEEMIQRVVDYQNRTNSDFIRGMGWDQNDWPGKEFPTKEKLDKLFPDIPVVLSRIDGHAMLVNQKALDLAGIDENSAVDGGTFVKKDGKLTGVLIDNARAPIRKILPESIGDESADALLRAQQEFFSYGVTSVGDAGVSHESILLMDKLAGEQKLKIGLYPMLIYTDPHLDEYLFEGLGENKFISSKSVKLFSDGALGSRGAALKEPYSDDPGNYGLMRETPEFINEFAEKMGRSDFQLNTHAIGDSADYVVLKAYSEVLADKPDRRWRVEHSQIVSKEDQKYFSKNIIPSVQPTHAVSDSRWAEDRLGADRIHSAYAYKDLLDQAGLLAFGTDAPIEEINPFRTFYAAVARMETDGTPAGGFLPNQAVSREDALRAMTIWAAFAEFDEDKKGSLEPGKQADFILIDRDLMKIPTDEIPHTKVKRTYVKGEKVFEGN